MIATTFDIACSFRINGRCRRRDPGRAIESLLEGRSSCLLIEVVSRVSDLPGLGGPD